MARVRMALPRNRGEAWFTKASIANPTVAALASAVTTSSSRSPRLVAWRSKVRFTVGLASTGSAHSGGPWPQPTVARVRQVPRLTAGPSGHDPRAGVDALDATLG